MNDQWVQAIDRWRAANGQHARSAAERTLLELAMQSGLRTLRRFREIPEDERRELVHDAFVRLLHSYPEESWSHALFLSVLTRLAIDTVRSAAHKTRRDAVRERSADSDEDRSGWDALSSDGDHAGAERRIDARAVMTHVRPLLSERDLSWLKLVLTGSTHQEIADQHRVAKAVVDKAMQRAWEKIRVAVGTEVRE
jgi:DNA-directed RNA polymerase specialized sigma24 family protein